MAYTLAVDTLVELTSVAYQNSQVIESIFHYRVTTAGVLNQAVEELQALVAQVQGVGGLIATLAAAQSSTVLYQIVRAQAIKPIRYAAVGASSTLVGARAGAAAPQNVAAVLTKYTELATARKAKTGKGQIGSLHVAGLLQADISQGLVTAPVREGVLADLADAMMVGITIPGGAILTPVIWHRTVAGTSTDNIVGVIPQVTARVMRRRTVGLGI